MITVKCAEPHCTKTTEVPAERARGTHRCPNHTVRLRVLPTTLADLRCR